VAKEGKLGRLLAKGSRAASEEIGGGSEAFLTDSKGLEAPMHDPRLNWGDGLAYAISVRGACHVSNMTYLLEWGAIRYPEIGLDKHYKEFSAEYRGEAVAKTTDLGCIMNSSCWCEFPGVIFNMHQWVDLFNAAAAYGYDLDALMNAGTRVWLLQRCLGHIWGATGADDRLGQRIMTPTKDGSIAGMVPDMETMLKDFYQYRGLREDGLPTRETLEKYGLGYLAEKLPL
jgi:aldehyde:ferredoxin oxidoreductase